MIASLYHSGSSVKRRPALPVRVALARSALLGFCLLPFASLRSFLSPAGGSRLRSTVLFAGISISCLSCADTPDGIRAHVGIEAQRLTPAGPVKTVLRQQVFDLNTCIVGKSKTFKRQVDLAMLGLERVEIDRHQYNVVAKFRRFSLTAACMARSTCL